MKYQIYDYDVYGNERDGYGVNNVYPALVGFSLFDAKNVYVDLTGNETDKEIVQKLKKTGWMNKYLKDSKFDYIDGEFEYGLYLSYRGIPACELRPVTD